MTKQRVATDRVRATFVRFAASGDTAILCARLRDAFDYFGGVPEHVLFDNTEAVVVERVAYGPGLHRWSDQMKALAEAAASHLARAGRTGLRPRASRALQLAFEGQPPRAARRTIELRGLRLTVEPANAHVGAG